jgi:hypothetical protein
MAGEIIPYQTGDGVTVIRLQAGEGKASAKAATDKVNPEYDRWHLRAINAPSAVEQHFIEATAKVRQIEAVKSKAPPKGRGDRT